MNGRHRVVEHWTCSSIRLPVAESCLVDPGTFELRQAELFEQGFPPDIPVVEEFSAVHFQIDEPEFPEHVCFGVVESFFPQPFREDGCDHSKRLVSALL